MLPLILEGIYKNISGAGPASIIKLSRSTGIDLRVELYNSKQICKVGWFCQDISKIYKALYRAS
jgi:hypothetical protein